jgi:hypothetical protein
MENITQANICVEKEKELNKVKVTMTERRE